MSGDKRIGTQIAGYRIQSLLGRAASASHRVRTFTPGSSSGLRPQLV
jgi:hypothetical protein